MNFSDILNDYAPYKGIVENLNNTPVSVAGIVESAQGQLIYSLKNENKALTQFCSILAIKKNLRAFV